MYSDVHLFKCNEVTIIDKMVLQDDIYFVCNQEINDRFLICRISVCILIPNNSGSLLCSCMKKIY